MLAEQELEQALSPDASVASKQIIYLFGAGATHGEADFQGSDINLLMNSNRGVDGVSHQGSPILPKDVAGAMKDLVFKVLALHEFVSNLGIPERRFARQTLCAQICINSFARAITGSFARTRYEDLQYFFQKFEHPTGSDKTTFDTQSEKIAAILDDLWQAFAKDTKRLRNRSYILSVYLFYEELSGKEGVISAEEKTKFAEFILTLWDSLKDEASKGIKRSDEGLYQFETYLSSAPGEKYQIERRHERLRAYYEHFNNTGGVTGLLVSADAA